jgi:hypothetical protein
MIEKQKTSSRQHIGVVVTDVGVSAAANLLAIRGKTLQQAHIPDGKNWR